MADRGVDVDRLDRIAAPDMDGVEHLAELDEVAVVGVVAAAPPAVAVGRVGRARHRAEGDVVAADLDVARRVAAMQGELRRRLAELALDEPAVEADALRVGVDIGARRLQQVARPVMEHVDADLLEHCQRGEVDGLERVLRHGGDGSVEKARLRLLLRRRIAAALRPGPAPIAALSRLLSARCFHV